MRYLLAIETSCDETSVAILENGRTVRANLISSQTELHRPYGGVVPELASRRHLEAIHPLLEQALEQSGVTLGELDGVAVTCGPGLIGAVVVGVAVAKSLAAALGIPLIGVNHLEGHLYSPFLESPGLQYPVLTLLVSGGHTMLVRMELPGRYRILGSTRDDAAGEAFDKVAKLLGLGYPGGPAVERAARTGNPDFRFPRPMLNRGYDFSFSGLKTAVRNFHSKHPEAAVEDVCAAFQEALVEVLAVKVERALKEEPVPSLSLAGGVAANGPLREALAEVCRRRSVEFAVPAAVFCTDNAAMIARAGFELHRLGIVSDLTLDAVANLQLRTRLPGAEGGGGGG